MRGSSAAKVGTPRLSSTTRSQVAARTYLASRAGLRRLTHGLLAVHEGVWLGALSCDSIEALDELVYSTHGLEYATSEHVESGLSVWEQAFVDRLQPSSRVGVAAAGAGREVLALLRQGHDAIGFEPHPVLVARGQEILAARDQPGHLREVPRSTWPHDVGTFDAVIVGWGGYMLIPDRPARIRFLTQIRHTVTSGSPLLVSFFAKSGDDRTDRLVDATAALTASLLARIGRAPERPVTLGDRLSPNLVHSFDEAEVTAELEDGGFRLDSFAAEPYGHAVGIAI